MKTLAKITVLIATLLTISINSFATGIDFNEESYINDIPLDLERIEAQLKYEFAVAKDFQMEEEEFIADMQFSEIELDALSAYYTAMAQNIDFEDEEYIDDIPNVITSGFLTLSE
jgi:hypothetical protein